LEGVVRTLVWLFLSLAVGGAYFSPWWLEHRRTRSLRVVGARPRPRDPLALVQLVIGIIFLIALYRAFEDAPLNPVHPR
jgi:hypothetical protein